MGKEAETLKVSVVVPVYNERDALPHLLENLRAALDPCDFAYEIIFCDDGSTDGGCEFIEAQAAEDRRIKLITLRRNFGQTAALDAGFSAAAGEIVVPIDADMQNDPADIPMLLDKLDQGYDVAKGWRKGRNDPLLTKVLPSALANRLISRLMGVRLHDYGCTLSAYRREILDRINLYGGMHRFIPVLAHKAGARIIEIPVRHHARKYGQSKYTVLKTFQVVLDMFTVKLLAGFDTKPLYFFGRFALFTFGIAGLSGVYSFYKKAFGGGAGWWSGEPVFTDPFFYAAAFFAINGVLMVLIGLLAEINVRTYYESQGLKPFVVAKTVNLESGEKP